MKLPVDGQYGLLKNIIKISPPVAANPTVAPAGPL